MGTVGVPTLGALLPAPDLDFPGRRRWLTDVGEGAGGARVLRDGPLLLRVAAGGEGESDEQNQAEQLAIHGVLLWTVPIAVARGLWCRFLGPFNTGEQILNGSRYR